MRVFRRFLALIAPVLAAAHGLAHDPGLSSVHLARTATGAEVGLAFAWSDLARLTSGPAHARPDAAQLATLGPAIAEAAGGFARLSASGAALPAGAADFRPDPATPADVLVTLKWALVPPGPIEAVFPVLARLPFGHRMIVTQGATGEAIALLDARHATWALPAPAGPRPTTRTEGATTRPVPLPWFSFIPLGIEHILTGYDHLCFLLALLLVALRFRDVLAVVTTFTVAHSLTLGAAALGVVSLPSAVVEPLIAASIVYVGVENLVLRRQPRHRLALVFGFGLIHGLGFASALTERLPGITGLAVIPPLLSFNLGVETGQLAVAASLVPLINWARSRRDYAPRLQPAVSCLVAVFGLVWFLQRVWPG